MFVRPFVWAECAQHIHVNLRPGCFQISRANPFSREGLSYKHIGVCSGHVCGKKRGGLGVDKPRSLGGSDACLKHCVDRGQPFGCLHALLFGPSVLSINISNVLPGCFQISRAKLKRSQLLKRGFVLEIYRRHLFGSEVRQKRQFWRTTAVSVCHERPPRPSRSRAVSACHKRPPRPSRSGAVSACSVPRARLARGRFRPVTSVPRARLARGRFPLVTSVHRASLSRARFPHVTSVHRASLARAPHQSRWGTVSACHDIHRASLARGRFSHVTSVPRASLACHERPPRQSRSGAVSACHKRPPRPSRSGAVSACHERLPRPSRSGAVFGLSRASPAPVSLGGGFRMSRASPAPVSLGGGFGLSRASPAPVSLGAVSACHERPPFRPLTSVPRAPSRLGAV